MVERDWATSPSWRRVEWRPPGVGDEELAGMNKQVVHLEYYAPADRKWPWPLWAVSVRRGMAASDFRKFEGFKVTVDFKTSPEGTWQPQDHVLSVPAFIVRRLGELIAERVK